MEYQERDIMEQGEYYTKHVYAMTAEGLHKKSAIAAELAERDITIEKLQQRNRELLAENELLRNGLKGDYDLDAWLDFAKERAALVARLARLENGIKIVLFADDEISELAAESLREKLNESPQASLAEIEAEAIEEIADEVDMLGEGVQVVSVNANWLRGRAANLREGK